MHVAFVRLFMNMRKLGSNFWLRKCHMMVGIRGACLATGGDLWLSRCCYRPWSTWHRVVQKAALLMVIVAMRVGNAMRIAPRTL